MRTKSYITTLFFIIFSLINASAFASSKNEITTDSNKMLQSLYKTNPEAKQLAQTSKGILIFPSIWRAGLLIGGQTGNGVLVVNNQVDSFYTSSSFTYGLQAGVKNYSYIMFFTSDESIKDLKDADGIEIGVGPTFIVVDKGISASLENETLDKDIYVFNYNQSGLMAGAGLLGTRINKINTK